MRGLKALQGPRLARFLVVGGLAALLLFVLSWVFHALGMAPFAAGTGAYALAFAFAYTAQRNWTFGAHAAHATALPRYLAVQLFCALLAGLCTHVASSWLGWPAPAAAGLATLAASAAGFVLSAGWAFAVPRRGKTA